MNNHSSQKSNQSQSTTIKTQPILPDRLRAEKQRTYLKKKELEAEEMSNIEEGAFVETKKMEKNRIVPKISGVEGGSLVCFRGSGLVCFFFSCWTRF